MAQARWRRLDGHLHDLANAVAGARVSAVVDPELGIIKWYREKVARMRAEQERVCVVFRRPVRG